MTFVVFWFVPQFFVRLDHIRKCFTQKGGIFILEEFSEFFFAHEEEFSILTGFLFYISDPKTRQIIQRKYKSPMVMYMEFEHLYGFI